MVKVPCHCTFYKCGGKDIDPRTQKAHSLRDRTAQEHQHAGAPSQSALAQKAVDTAEDVIQNQLDTIIQHLATTKLSNSPKADSSLDIVHNLSPSLYQPTEDSSVRIARVHRVLERLSEIEFSASTLHAEVATKLHHSQRLPFLRAPLFPTLHAEVATKLHHSQRLPFLRAPLFPLAKSIDNCRHLESDLTKITCKSPAVTAAKDAVRKQVDVIKRMLQSAKEDWEKAQEVVQHPKKSSIEYSNGN
ncbi:hypothetical protein CVT25_006789 [Psilocybe cyanescens]|uniref:Uncharacterized protein n=1 Tax=Psilocybe cyanescens TaxID=93625 RepID=A0A409WYI3_PSICY|nr:hypothetical protein CVT25_006789 [Psilocybe cyanescens]